jgi:hypothetical protein
MIIKMVMLSTLLLWRTRVWRMKGTRGRGEREHQKLVAHIFRCVINTGAARELVCTHHRLVVDSRAKVQ